MFAMPWCFGYAEDSQNNVSESFLCKFRLDKMRHWYPLAKSPLDHAHKKCLQIGWSLKLEERPSASVHRTLSILCQWAYKRPMDTPSVMSYHISV